MTRQTNIPHGPIDLGYTLGGFLPQVGLHRRGQAYYQQSSYWHLGISAPFVIAALVCPFLQLNTYTKCVFVGFFLFMGGCGVAPYFVRNRFGQTVIVDPPARWLYIKAEAEEKRVAWSDIVALQLCRQERPSVAYQINLVWRCPDGGFERRCLAMHEVKRYALGLARRYASLLCLKLNDESTRSHPKEMSR